MAIISTGNNFGTTDAVTSTRLNNIANAATFVSGAVDGTSLELISGGSDDGKLGIKDAGITTAKIAAGALTNLVYPIGSIFTTVTNYANSAAVVNAIGGTTWTVFGAGRVLVGLDSSDTDFDTVEETGGAKTHTLSVMKCQLTSTSFKHNPLTRVLMVAEELELDLPTKLGTQLKLGAD